jgi:hypothetical protein
MPFDMELMCIITIARKYREGATQNDYQLSIYMNSSIEGKSIHLTVQASA